MSKRQSKKEHILHAGMLVMKVQGYNGTSVKDIVDAAGVPKGSFYNYFDSKEAFAVEALQNAAAEDYQANSRILSNQQQEPLQRLREYFIHHAQEVCDNDFQIGCFLGNMCQEMADNSAAIRLAVKTVLQTNTRQLAAVLEEAQRRGDIKADADIEQLAQFLFNAWQGALLRMKAAKNSEPLDIFLSLFPRLLNL
ncbi:TetR family transcriptional regulator C-terminal domain-containing protein [Porticoccus sp. W117]|uniref:TetR/AcrR family transcriptional regulator n=1 Tax=Porticoccus sp. W117 TaxID=3054777 RepID=UPI0025998938|nr:TetR/AcrR family transcriptional regulator [Porticoccus sp. W117]MDM3869987.1 TetR family transcriptional regulator C-terminal domain-containing protein [Porticoccus sp. W117]